MSKTKKRALYAARDGGSSDVSIFLGKPKEGEDSCGECGGTRKVFQSGRGSRFLTDVCTDGFEATGIELPEHGGLVKFSVQVEE